MGEIRETLTPLKHQEIYDDFLALQASYGDLARHLSKGFFYDQVAEKRHCNPDHVRKVCNKLIKSGGEASK